MIAKVPRKVTLLFAGLGVVLALAACDNASVTQPDATRRTLKANPRFDEDSLTCISGFIVINGRVVCQ